MVITLQHVSHFTYTYQSRLIMAQFKSKGTGPKQGRTFIVVYKALTLFIVFFIVFTRW